jgi:hypothetical protein
MEGSLSCHTCCDTEPLFFRFHPKDGPIQSTLTTHKGMRRIYSNSDPHWLKEHCNPLYTDINTILYKKKMIISVEVRIRQKSISTWCKYELLSGNIIFVYLLFYVFHSCWRCQICKIKAYARRSWPLSGEGSLSCHTCCDTWPRFFQCHPKVRPIQSPLTTHKRMWRTYSSPYPHQVFI